MSLTDAFSIGLALVVVGLALWTVAARDAFAAVVGFVAYGMLLTLVWVRLDGFDVALTEAALGSGLTGAMLIRAAGRLRDTEATASAEGPGAMTRLVAALAGTPVTPRLALAVATQPVIERMKEQGLIRVERHSPRAISIAEAGMEDRIELMEDGGLNAGNVAEFIAAGMTVGALE